MVRIEWLGVMGVFGLFGGMFDLSSLYLKEFVFVFGMDGVGIKLFLVIEVDKYDIIGIDCVVMCVNDILV